MNNQESLRKSGPELVLALVGALGTNLEELTNNLIRSLKSVGYKSHVIRMSSLLHEIKDYEHLPTSPLDEHIERHQEAGNDFRLKTKFGGAMGALAIAAIRKNRDEVNGNPDNPIPRCAYIIRSLKHPDEVIALKETYGIGFYLVAGYSPRVTRVETLSKDIARSRHSANVDKFRKKSEFLIVTDEAETGNRYGQNVRDTYPLADVFFDLSNPNKLKKSIKRFIEIVYGYPFHTPTRDEYVMFHANASALRSSDLSRQVGAAISTDDGDVIAVGTNEVPKAGGGLYWPDDEPDFRDFVFSKDHGAEMKKNTLGEVIKILKDSNWLNDQRSKLGDQELLDQAVPIMKGTQIMNIGEYGRTVHAEMASLLDAARRGVSVYRNNLFTTTFPCHNCAKHIVASGIRRVVYIEPYPKSLATILHVDSISSDGSIDASKITFEPFVGIAPRRYISLFTMLKRKGSDGNRVEWEENFSTPRYLRENAHITYINREKEITYFLKERMDAEGLQLTKSV